MIQKIVDLSRQERFRNRIVFLEDYDMIVARYLVQGCDVWLNTPSRPQEASGTSGMKAAANGVLNMAHWMGGGLKPITARWGGPSVGARHTTTPITRIVSRQEALYDLLERDVVPFYDRVGVSHGVGSS